MTITYYRDGNEFQFIPNGWNDAEKTPYDFRWVLLRGEWYQRLHRLFKHGVNGSIVVQYIVPNLDYAVLVPWSADIPVDTLMTGKIRNTMWHSTGVKFYDGKRQIGFYCEDGKRVPEHWCAIAPREDWI